jgi:NTP pyrophosphatase (non-canonical NTP hydrolase)
MINGDLKNFIETQDGRLKKTVENYPDEEKRVFARMIKLTEEVGELADEVLAESSFQRQEKLDVREKDNIEAELADVIITALLLAKTLGVDADKALRDKIDKINGRYDK